MDTDPNHDGGCDKYVGVRVGRGGLNWQITNPYSTCGYQNTGRYFMVI